MFRDTLVALLHENEILEYLLVELANLLDVLGQLGLDPQKDVSVIVVVHSVLLLIESQCLKVGPFTLVHRLI